MNAADLVESYFELWRTTDDNERHAYASKLFTPGAVHYAAPANEKFTGVDEIEANIARVNTENIQKAGLKFRAGGFVVNHDSVQVNWEVTDPGGAKVLGAGRDFLLLDEDGRIKALYMFMHSA